MSTVSGASFRYNVIDETSSEYCSKTGLNFDELLADVEYMAALVADSDAKERGYMPETIIASLKQHDFAGASRSGSATSRAAATAISAKWS